MQKKIYILLLFINLAGFAQQDINNRFLLAQSFEQAGEFVRAREILEELYNNNPGNYQVFESLIRVNLQLKEYDESIRIIKERLNQNDQDVNLYGLLGKTYYMNGDENAAFQIWDEAIKKFPDNSSVYRSIASFAMERRAFDKAVEILEKGKELSAEKEDFSYELARLYSVTMRFREAVAEYCILLKERPGNLQMIEARILSFINNPAARREAAEVVEKFRSEDNRENEYVFSYLLARLYIEERNFESAFELYSELDQKQDKQGADLFNFASLAFNEEEYSLAAKAYRRVIEEYPHSPVISSAKLGFAKTMEADLVKDLQDEKWKPYYKPEDKNPAQTEKVISAYEELCKSYPGSEVAGESLYRIGLVYLYRKNDIQAASRFFNRVADEYTFTQFSIAASGELANISLMEEDLEKAAGIYQDVIRNSRVPQDEKNSARYKLARIKFYQGDYSSAKNLLEEIIRNLKDNSANDAIELSLLLNTAAGDSVNLSLFAEGEKYAAMKDFSRAAQKFSLLSQNQNSFLFQGISRLRLAEMELALNNVDKSIELLEIISDETSMNIYSDKALYLLGRIYQYGVKDILRAVQAYEKLLAKFPSSLYLDEAREEIIKLRDKQS